MARMRSNTPARKVVAGSISVAITTVAIWIFEISTDIVVPDTVRAAIITIVSFLVGYITPPSPNDGIVGGPGDPQ